MALIKHADLEDLTTVLPLDLDARATGPLEPFLEAAPVAARPLSESERLLADTRKTVRLLEDRLADEVSKAREQGRKDAEAAYARDEATLVALLKSSLEIAQARAAQSFDEMERLALLVCENALAKVFDKPQSYRSLVTDAISRQLQQIRKETVVSLWVSQTDFPDRGALEALSTTIAAGGVNAQQDASLGSGNCRIGLRLGHIELSLPDHWQALKSCLGELASEDRYVQR